MTRMTIVIGAAMLIGAGAACADPAGDYERLFGDQDRKVSASRTKADDLQFADSLIKVVRDVSDTPALQVLLCEKIVRFASGSLAGSDTAIEALQLLETAAPDKKDQWAAMKLDVARLRFAKSRGSDKKAAGQSYMEMLESAADNKVTQGDGAAARAYYSSARSVASYLRSPRLAAINTKSKRATAVIARQAKLKSLQAKLAADPKNISARTELITLYVADFDQPEQAAKLLTDDIDTATRKYVPMAVRELAQVDESDCMEMGDWCYRKLSPKASAVGKPLILQRAWRYYRRFLGLFPDHGGRSHQAKLAVKKIETELARLGVSVRPEFPPGILVALSFEKGQLVEAADGASAVKNISGRAGAVPIVKITRGKTGLPGKIGGGVSLPAGDKGEVTIPSKTTANLKTFTFAFWVKTEESGVGKTFWSNPTLLGIRTVGGGSRDFGITSNQGRIGYWSGLGGVRRDYDHQSTININDGKWRHVALTNDGRTMLLYVNGSVVSPKGLPAGALVAPLDVLLGAARSDIADSYGALNHSGVYDELQVYGRALTAKEIAGIGVDKR